MKRYLFVALLLLLPVGYGAVKAQETWTLKQCIDHALAHNISVKQQQNRIEKLQTERKNFKNSYLPNLTLGSSQKFDFGRSLNRSNTYEDSNSQSTAFSLNTEMPLFTGFRISGSIAKSNFDLLAAQENGAVIVNNLSLNVTSAYFQILLNKEILHIAQQQIALTQEQEQRTVLLIENGKAPQSQLFDVRAQLADDELTATEARNTLRLSVVELMQLLELSGQMSFDITPLGGEVGGEMIQLPEAVYAVSLGCMPQIREAQHLLSSGEKAVKVARSGYYPTLSLGAGVSSNYYSLAGVDNFPFGEQFKNNMQKSIYLSLSIPLFDRLATRNKVRTARIELDDARLSLENEKKTLYKEIENAYTDVVTSKEKYAATSKSATANAEAHRYALEKYAAGKSAVYEYNETKMKLANALSQQAQAKYTYLLKTKVLAFYEGNPLVE